MKNMYWMTRKITHEEDALKIACFAYCEGKPFWWRWFYGWRLTDREGCVFILTEKAWINLFEIVYGD